ncbi:RbsD/FucU domain-containing protein [Rhodococcus koreensis]
MSEAKVRILHQRLAAIVASLRHGDMVFLADAGSPTDDQSITPLSSAVEYIDLSVVTGVPSLADVLPALWEVGDFEAAFVTKEMTAANPDGRKLVSSVVGEEKVHEVRYKPDFYHLRDRVKVLVRLGDYSIHGNVVLIAGYSSAPIDPKRLLPATS